MHDWPWSSRCWLTVGAVLALLAVAAGAFAAHLLDGYFQEKYAGAEPKTVAGFEVPASWKYLQDFQTGAKYHMYHALGLIAVGILSGLRPKASLHVAGWAFLLGIVGFSGSLYVLTLTGRTWWAVITPIGGTLFLVGWIALAVGVCPWGNSSSGRT